MTTTTGTTGTASTTSAISTATQQLLTSLDTGSGVDTGSLVTGLVQAQFAAQTARLTAKADTLTAQVSGVGTLKSAVSGFATALETLVKGGSLATQPTSSNAAVLGAAALPGASLSNLRASVTVGQLAAAQSVRSATPVADRTAAIGSGSFTLTLGSADYATDADGVTTMTGFTAGSAAAVTIDVTDASLDGIAAAINAKKTGVTASVITDADGSAFLSLKGATGRASAFTLAATSDPSGALGAFAVGPDAGGTVLTGEAQNARLTVDGVSVERASNTVSDLIDGVKLTLTATSTVPVTLGASRPTDALTQAVADVVETYNQMLSIVEAQVDPITGPLRSDPAAQSLLRSMKTLTSQPLLTGAAAGTPTTLAEIGVATNRDGTLKVNATTLSNALATWPDAVEAMFGYSASGTSGISARLNALASSATSKVYGLGASELRYTAAQGDLSEQQDKIADQSSQLTTRLTQQFASMNSKVAAYKSTQSFLKNQIDAWNNSNN